MSLLPNIIFAIILFSGLGFFARNVSKLKRNIYLGKDVDTSGDIKLRWTNMAKIALGQGKMVRRPRFNTNVKGFSLACFSARKTNG